VGLVNETFAARHWPGHGAVGRRIRASRESPWLTVVGVVRDIRHLGPSQPARPEVYVPLSQAPFSFMAIVVRADGDPRALVTAVRREVARLDPAQPIAGVNTMAGHLEDSMAVPRFLAIVFGLFGVLSLVLAGLGIHGVMAWSVVQRRREIGTRMAMGASSRAIAAGVVRHGAALVAAGVAGGLAMALALQGQLSKLLEGPSVGSVTAYAVALGALLLVAVASLWVPAYRASRVAPASVLRE
jgi:ABC-type antimicrobial peptide transport system permease subunit